MEKSGEETKQFKALIPQVEFKNRYSKDFIDAKVETSWFNIDYSFHLNKKNVFDGDLETLIHPIREMNPQKRI
jgi:hypothetical protein